MSPSYLLPRTFAVLAVALVSVAFCEAVAEKCVNTTHVCHNYYDDSNKKLQKQVNMELWASYLYLSYSYFFGRSDIALPGFTKFFARESLEERTHADNLLTYINKRGGKVIFNDIKYYDNCQQLNRSGSICDIILGNDLATNISKLGLTAFRDALTLEKVVSGHLESIIAENDYQLNHFIENEYLDEQVDTIKIIGDYVRQLEMFSDDQYTLGQYIFDKNLLKSIEDEDDDKVEKKKSN